MLQYKRGMCISVLFFISFNFIPIAFAEEELISISLDCLESCKDQELNYSKDIMLVLTIRNNLDSWVAIEGWGTGTQFRIDVSNDKLRDGKESEIYYNFLGESFIIRPNDEVKVYTYFNIYNKIPKDNRLGYWTISPNLLIHELMYYKVPYESKGTAYFMSYEHDTHTVKGNDLQFTVKKPESKINVQGKSSEKISTELWEHPLLTNIIYPIITDTITRIAVVILLVYFGYDKLRKKKR